MVPVTKEMIKVGRDHGPKIYIDFLLNTLGALQNISLQWGSEHSQYALEHRKEIANVFRDESKMANVTKTNAACSSASLENLIYPWFYAKTSIGSILYHFVFTNNSYYFYLSNLSRIYWETLNEAEIEAKSKELNPNLEIGTELLFKLVERSTSHECLSAAKILLEEDLGTIKIETKFDSVGFPFAWIFETKKKDDITTRDNLIQPLLGISAFLFDQNESLVKIIEKKDQELEDLKNQGGKVSRKYLETQKFDRESMKLKDKLPKIIVNSALKTIFGDESTKYVYKHVVNELREKSNNDETLILKNVETKVDLKSEESSTLEDTDLDQSSLEMRRRDELQKRLANQEKGNKKKKKIKF